MVAQHVILVYQIVAHILGCIIMAGNLISARKVCFILCLLCSRLWLLLLRIALHSQHKGNTRGNTRGDTRGDGDRG